MSANQVSKKNPFKSMLFWAISIIILNILIAPFYLQMDLTHDKRYTLHDKTKKMLKELESPVIVRIFLTGDELPADYKRLSVSTENILRTFRNISGNKVDYVFIDPTLLDSTGIRKMNEYGIYTIPVKVSKGKKGTKQIPVSPFVLVESEKGGIPVPLLLGNINIDNNIYNNAFNEAEILLEYNIANAIRKVNKTEVDTVLYLVGNEQSSGLEVYRMATQISLDYVFLVDTLQNMNFIPEQYKVVIINKPRKAFSEHDKYKLDQYLMKGGNLLFNLEMTTASYDSFKLGNSSFTSLPIDLNLNDLLFTYGVRVNQDIVSDLDQCEGIPVRNSDVQNAESSMLPFRYLPLVKPGSAHPIVRQLNNTLIKYGSSIDFVNDQSSVKKTVLLQTSKHSRIESVPKLFELNSLFIEPMRSSFDQSHLKLGVLAEGKFTSLYNQRLPEELSSFSSSLIKESQKESRIVIYSDGDIFENEISERYGPMEIGAYMYSPVVYENSSLLSNTLEYLTDTTNILDVRSKNYSPSILDRKRIQDENTVWQAINIGSPIIIVILFGLIFTFNRRNKYSK